MAAQRKYSPRPILGKGEDLATALHQEVQAISNALTSLESDLKKSERKYKDETDKALAEVIERFLAEISEVNGRIISIAEWSIEITNEIKGKAAITALNALRTRIESQGDEITSYAQYIVALNNTVNGKADVHVILRLENLIQVLGDNITAYGAVIQEIQLEVDGKASAQALQALEASIVVLEGNVSALSSALTALQATVFSGGTPNRLNNSEFQGWSPWTFSHAPSTSGYELELGDTNFPTWSLPPGTLNNTGLIKKQTSIYTSASNYAQLAQSPIPVEPEQWYQFSIYMSAHRCIGSAVIEWLSGAQTVLKTDTSNPVTTAGTSQVGGRPLSMWERGYVIAQAPEDAEYVRGAIRHIPNGSPSAQPNYLFFTCPLFGNAAEGQTSPSPYSSGGSGGTAAALKQTIVRVDQHDGEISALVSDVTDLSTRVQNPKPGQNMLVDPIFQITRDGAWSFQGTTPWVVGLDEGGYRLESDSSEHTPFLYGGAVYPMSTTQYGAIIQTKIPVLANTRYQFSCYLGAHRCEGLVIVTFQDINGDTISGANGTSNSLTQPTAIIYPGGRYLHGYNRVFGFTTSPPNARTSTFRIQARWQGPTPSSVTDPKLFMIRPFMGTAEAEQTEPSDWAPGAPGNMFAHLRSEGMVWANSTGEGSVGASYQLMLRAEDNTGVAEAGLGITAAKVGGVWRSQFDITADQFRIISPNNGNPTVPFKIFNNVAYIKSVAILDGDITNAKILNLSADKLTAGSIAVGQNIQSTGFVSQSSGWRITGSGAAEFDAVHVRGQLTGTQIADQIINTQHLASQAAMFMVPFSITGQGGCPSQLLCREWGDWTSPRRVVAFVQVNIPYTTGLAPNNWYQFTIKVTIDNSVNVVASRSFSVKSDSSGVVNTFSQMFYGLADLSEGNAWAGQGERYAFVELTVTTINTVWAAGTLICQKN
ncbi:MAG: DUF1983 domain-containing protein [Candidatus Competibacteraceae bacterium]|nr:DUF1983 domain-containing protein [Candidatus Competibacteraceae bacterium]